MLDTSVLEIFELDQIEEFKPDCAACDNQALWSMFMNPAPCCGKTITLLCAMHHGMTLYRWNDILSQGFKCTDCGDINRHNQCYADFVIRFDKL